MSSKAELARKYAGLIREGATADAGRNSGQVQESVGSAKRSHLLTALTRIKTKLDGLTSDDEPISEELRQEIVGLIAEELGYKKPKKLGRLLQESVTALMTMSQSIEDLFAAVRK